MPGVGELSENSVVETDSGGFWRKGWQMRRAQKDGWGEGKSGGRRVGMAQESTLSMDSGGPRVHEAGHQEGQEPQVHGADWFPLQALRIRGK